MTRKTSHHRSPYRRPGPVMPRNWRFTDWAMI